MSIARKVAGLALVAYAAFMPQAHADFPYTCDSAVCFATWCVAHLGDCRDGSPNWMGCDPDLCFGCTGDISCYVLYCTVFNSPVACVR